MMRASSREGGPWLDGQDLELPPHFMNIQAARQLLHVIQDLAHRHLQRQLGSDRLFLSHAVTAFFNNSRLLTGGWGKTLAQQDLSVAGGVD